ncbi:DUF2993 domain-containing protein [Ammonicoccus fulvus]|uniref:DUF2993 domain-containing protein n=1 Tax=Ammonicoccus fulvus TaxID=3138240 RepID=A0ABZ3FST3_9ACTN
MTRRRGRGCVVLPVVVVLVLAGLFALDRWAVGRVETEVSSRVRTQMGLPEDPGVTIHGFPFLTQVATNRFERVDLQGRGLPAGTQERPLTVDRMELELTGVRTADTFRKVSADQLTGMAYVTWAELTHRAGVPISEEEGGRVRVDITADLYGQQVPFVVSAKPMLDVPTQQIRLTEPRVIVASYQVPDVVVQRIADESVPPFPLELPMGIRASSLQTGPDELRLGLEGADVALVR